MDNPDGHHSLISSLLARSQFPSPGSTVRCAVSGGPDSMALLVLACAADLEVTAVHVDHGIRLGSAEEAEVVAEAARRFGAGFEAHTVDVGDTARSDLEQRMRVARQSVLGPDAFTGHTADDQAETQLINLLRGAGTAGLAGMRPGPPHPILALRRADTHGLCAALDLSPIEDPSNHDPRFVRNRVRHELLPLMQDISGRDMVPLLCRTADTLRSTADDIDAMAAALDPTDTRHLQHQPETLVISALRRWLRDDLGHPPSHAELGRVLAVVRHQTIACELAGGRRVTRSNGRLTLLPPAR